MIREQDGISWIEPQWPAPHQVRAASTLRMGGISAAPFDNLNLALHVGDAREAVLHNRQRVAHVLNLPGEPCWLQQVHGINVVAAGSFDQPPVADASFTATPGQVCAVMTADCLPVLFCNREGTCVAVAHAGWRGLSAGVLEATIRAMNVQASTLLAWLGPAIGRDVYEVGDEVRDVFITRNSANDQCFIRNEKHRWLADMNALACNELRRLGVHSIFNDAACTANDAQFFSYRRDGRTGRMASMIWLQPGH